MVSIQCPVCSGVRPFCIHKSYPIERPKDLEKRVKEKLKKDFFGPSYSVFIGSFGYPEISIGPLAGLEEVPNLDNPTSWFGMSYQQIIELRSMLVRSKQQENIFSKNKFIQKNQELALASKPTYTEIFFRKKPIYTLSLSDSFQPMGPTGIIEKFRVAENIKIGRKVEYIVKDDLKASDAATLLYQNNQDVYKITTIFSSGVLGQEETKKLVPTKWSITATDDIIGKYLIEKIKNCRQIPDYLVFQSSYMDNHFTVLLMPGSWEFENFEVWSPNSNWHEPTMGKIVEEYEPYEGRKNYAEKQAGGYYATRLAVTEYLEKIQKQAKAVVFREVGPGYTVPLGVWQCRENARNAVRQSPNKFSTEKEALEYIKSVLRFNLADYAAKSVILKRKTILNYLTKAH